MSDPKTVIEQMEPQGTGSPPALEEAACPFGVSSWPLQGVPHCWASAKPSTKHQVTGRSMDWLRNKPGFALWREHELVKF